MMKSVKRSLKLPGCKIDYTRQGFFVTYVENSMCVSGDLDLGPVMTSPQKMAIICN